MPAWQVQALSSIPGKKKTMITFNSIHFIGYIFTVFFKVRPLMLLRKTIQDIVTSNDILNWMPGAQEIEAKTHQSDYIKFKTSVQPKEH